MEELLKILTDNIISHREQQQMSQVKLAELCGISPKYLSLIESRKRTPTLATVQKIAEGLGIKSYLLFSISGQEKAALHLSDSINSSINSLQEILKMISD